MGVLAALDAAEEEVAAIAGLRSGRVRLMAFPSSSATLVPRALSLVKTRFPDVSVSFSEAEPPEALAALRAGDCDLAVTFAYEHDDVPAAEDLDLFVSTVLLEDEVRLAVPRTHPLAEAGEVGLADVGSESWIAGCPRCRGHLLSLARRSGFTPTVSYETEDYVAVLGLVGEGLGVALVPDLILAAAKHDGVATLSLKPASRRVDHGGDDRGPAAGARRQGDPRGARRERRRAPPDPAGDGPLAHARSRLPHLRPALPESDSARSARVTTRAERAESDSSASTRARVSGR